jgi:hypothetical protein
MIFSHNRSFLQHNNTMFIYNAIMNNSSSIIFARIKKNTLSTKKMDPINKNNALGQSYDQGYYLQEGLENLMIKSTIYSRLKALV